MVIVFKRCALLANTGIGPFASRFVLAAGAVALTGELRFVAKVFVVVTSLRLQAFIRHLVAVFSIRRNARIVVAPPIFTLHIRNHVIAAVWALAVAEILVAPWATAYIKLLGAPAEPPVEPIRAVAVPIAPAV
jgi:hypothetical protein